jgi:hypothetical protein
MHFTKEQLHEELVFQKAYREMKEKHYRDDLAVQERRNQKIAENEAARVARGEPRQPVYVFPPDWEAYKARAAYLMTRLPSRIGG